MTQNETPTCQQIDTKLTGDSFPSVRASLIAIRAKHGADTPMGHRCSNLIEQLQNWQDASEPQRIGLQLNIARSVAEMAALNAEDREAP